MFTIITTSNTKLGGSIAQVNMPYLLSCRPDAPCSKECYCTHGNMAYDNVRQSHIKKYEMYKSNPVAFFNAIDNELNFIPFKYFRWHSSGDIVDMQYLDLMCKLARKHKETMFLCFTKKYEIINEYLNNHKKPNNLTIVLSTWKEWKPDNPHNLPISCVIEKEEDIPLYSYECPGSCQDCNGQHCWHMKKGDVVSFHKH